MQAIARCIFTFFIRNEKKKSCTTNKKSPCLLWSHILFYLTTKYCVPLHVKTLKLWNSNFAYSNVVGQTSLYKKGKPTLVTPARSDSNIHYSRYICQWTSLLINKTYMNPVIFVGTLSKHGGWKTYLNSCSSKYLFLQTLTHAFTFSMLSMFFASRAKLYNLVYYKQCGPIKSKTKWWII